MATGQYRWQIWSNELPSNVLLTPNNLYPLHLSFQLGIPWALCPRVICLRSFSLHPSSLLLSSSPSLLFLPLHLLFPSPSLLVLSCFLSTWTVHFVVHWSKRQTHTHESSMFDQVTHSTMESSQLKNGTMSQEAKSHTQKEKRSEKNGIK